MRKLIGTMMLFTSLLYVQGQQAYRDSLKIVLALAKDDATKFVIANQLFYAYYNYPDSAMAYVQQEVLAAENSQSELTLAKAYIDYAIFFEVIGDFPQSLHYAQEALKLAEKTKSWLVLSWAYSSIGIVYLDEGDYENARLYIKKAKLLFDQNWTPSLQKDLYTGGDLIGDTLISYSLMLSSLAEVYEKTNELDSSLKYVKILNDQTIQISGAMDWAVIPYYYGNIALKKKDYLSALRYYNWGMALAVHIDANIDIMKNGMGSAKTFRQLGNFDSSIFYANRVIQVSLLAYNPTIKLEALNLLASIYKLQNKVDSVAKYFELVVVTKDSLFGQNKTIELQRLRFDEQLRQQKQAKQQEEFQNKIKLSALFAALFVLSVIGSLLYRNNRHKQRANMHLTQEKKKVESTLSALKSTQAQLIQSEKMASLGEMSAGIAHEIQNPLNFINNFSDVNMELLAELKDQLKKRNVDEGIALADDVISNEEKIHHHGKRADAIVKGMLQHSQASKGRKEPTNINKLADEYLRLAYHGCMSGRQGVNPKDKDLNCEFVTEFDGSIGSINIIPQDIGRVIVNLINNAFYAVDEKSRTATKDYMPAITVSTKQLTDRIEISVADNGNGIPDKNIDKIFNPFFTTKPTGQGTGLGLSLSYDIVKAHGGEFKVETKEGEGSKIIFQLPTA